MILPHQPDHVCAVLLAQLISVESAVSAIIFSNCGNTDSLCAECWARHLVNMPHLILMAPFCKVVISVILTIIGTLAGGPGTAWHLRNQRLCLFPFSQLLLSPPLSGLAPVLPSLWFLLPPLSYSSFPTVPCVARSPGSGLQGD